MEDNLYPNAGEYFVPTEPEDQKVDRDEQIAQTLDAIPLLREVLEHYDYEINQLKDITTIASLDETDKFMHEVAARQLAVLIMEKERGYILGRLEQTVK